MVLSRFKKFAQFSLIWGLALILFTGLSRTHVSASTWHSGTPSWTHGYWHTKGGAGATTFHFFKGHIWNRNSGWQRVFGNKKSRAPWHGDDCAKYQMLTKKVAFIHARVAQTGTYEYLGIQKVSKNKLKMGYWDNDEQAYTDVFNLYRGNR